MLISALLDDEITLEEQVTLTNHLKTCGECEKYLNEQKAIRSAMRKLTASAPEGFAAGIMARVHETPQDRGPEKKEAKSIAFPGLRRYAGLAACCAVVALGIFAVSSMGAGGADSAAPEAAGGMAMMQCDTAANMAPQTSSENRMLDAGTTAESETTGAADAAEDRAVMEMTLLTTGSALAADWVEEELGTAWTVGSRYDLTEEQYETLRGILSNAAEPFTEELTEGGSEYCLQAE